MARLNELYPIDSLEYELSKNSLDYGVNINGDRAIPDAKSGLKPVARRILYDAFVKGHISSKPHVKSARIVGDTMGWLHPHGDSSIYGAMVRLAQDWVMRYPLIDIHGNAGNVLGDGPASMRYTEARLTKLSEEGMLNGLKKRNVDFIPNYDETEEEPITLPATFPNLLCNPNEGIGWAMGCSWAPHNLKEVGKAIEDYLNGLEPSLPGPDFPTGGKVINEKDIPSIMKTGHGSVKIRGQYKIEGQNIVFYELPYGTRLESLMEEIGKAADEGNITNVSDIRNETSAKRGIRLVIEVDKGITPEIVVAQLFAKTNLQTSFSYNQVALVGKTPTELNLKDAIKIYVEHNIDCIVREAQHDMKKASDRLHIVDGLLKALEDIDNIIALIKRSESAAIAKTKLIEVYNFTEVQAKAILDMKLAKLANLEKVELQKEAEELQKKIDELDWLINHDDAQKDELKNRLSAIVNKYGDARRTELTNIIIPKEEKETVEVVPEDVAVVVTQTGLIKKIPRSAFKPARRNTKGIKTVDDALLNIIKTNTVDTIMFFTDKGKMYRTTVNNIPTGDNKTRGTLISSLVKIDKDEKVIAVSSINKKTDNKYIIFITKDGLVKKTALEEYFKTNRNSGIAALKIKEGDKVVSILFQNDEPIVLVTKKGLGIKFKGELLGAMGRIAQGVRGIKLAEDDEVIAGLTVKPRSKMGIFLENGVGKRSPFDDMPMQGRGGKGVMITKLSETTGNVAAAAVVTEEDYVLICGATNNLCIIAAEIPVVSRISTGNILIKGNKIKKAVVL